MVIHFVLSELIENFERKVKSFGAISIENQTFPCCLSASTLKEKVNFRSVKIQHEIDTSNSCHSNAIIIADYVVILNSGICEVAKYSLDVQFVNVLAREQYLTDITQVNQFQVAISNDI